MKFDLEKSLQIVERTPGVLYSLLDGIDEAWTHHNEGPGTWSPFDVLGHLIVCEKTNFISRIDIILSGSANKVFSPIDMQAHFRESAGKSMNELLSEFELLRKYNLTKLRSMHLTDEDFSRQGISAKVGSATLAEILATWVVHDLSHLSQITRVMGKQYRKEVGPFIQFIRMLN